ncbi:MAG: S-ribosylhomocysteine lyase, partial [Clostridia bacterium]
GFYCLGEMHNVYTYDMRFKIPNGGEYLDIAGLHSIEHLFATVIRNSDIAKDVIYFGPMGCRTGCYLLLWNIEKEQAKKIAIDCLEKCLTFDTVPGAEKIECGNYLEHNLDEAKKEIANYLKVLKN